MALALISGAQPDAGRRVLATTATSLPPLASTTAVPAGRPPAGVAAAPASAPPTRVTSAPPATTGVTHPAPLPRPARVGPAPVAAAAAAPAAAAPAGTWAVVIGVNDYARGEDLHFAEADAQDVATALSGLGTQADHLRVLTGAAATGPAVRGAIDWLVAHAGPDALAVVFFAGHVRRLGPGAEGLRLADESVLADSELAERLAGLRSRRVWVTVAGCFGGGFTEVLAPGRVLTAAAAAGEYAYETTEFDRSYLVRYMIREALIERRSAPTVQDAFAYAAARQRHDFRPVQFEMDAPVMDLRS